MIKTFIEEYDADDFNGDIDHMIDRLETIKKQIMDTYPETLGLRVEFISEERQEAYSSPYTYRAFEVQVTRPETWEEKNARKNMIKIQERNQHERDIAQLKALQKKLGK